MRAWEVFDPRDGRALFSVRFRFVARLLARFSNGLDYGRCGEGWTR